MQWSAESQNEGKMIAMFSTHSMSDDYMIGQVYHSAAEYIVLCTYMSECLVLLVYTCSSTRWHCNRIIHAHFRSLISTLQHKAPYHLHHLVIHHLHSTQREVSKTAGGSQHLQGQWWDCDTHGFKGMKASSCPQKAYKNFNLLGSDFVAEGDGEWGQITLLSHLHEQLQNIELFSP